MPSLISGPYNLLALADGDEIALAPARYELGEANNPRGMFPPGTRVPMVRVWEIMRPGEPPPGAVDITSGRLVAILPRLLDEFAGSGARLRIRATGAPPRTTYTVTVDPA